ncbi:MAG: PepSY-associated TM helix domain-containing protein, partial [Planctomycetota bacterium]
RKLVLIGARTPRDVFWIDQLRAIPNTEIRTVVQEPDSTWTGPVGVITSLLDHAEPTDWPEVYTCGSPGMVDAVHARLVVQRFEATRIHSDSFLPAGTKPTALSQVSPTPPPRRDWPGLLRRVHYIAAAPVAMVLLFYAITGFIANRSDVFISEDGSAPSARQVPAMVPLTRAALAPFYAGLLPARAHLDGWGDGQPGEATFRDGDRGWRVRVSPETRKIDVQAFGAIPAAIENAPAAIAAHLTRHISGTPNLAQAEIDATSLALDFESVWGTHHVTIDTAAHTWTSTSTSPYFVVALVDLHRGKHAGAWQKIIVDVTAIVLALITLSGMAMGLIPIARRRQAVLLLGFSVVLLAFLLLQR